MTTVLEQPADLLDLVGQSLGATDWMKVTQQIDLFADATGDRRMDPHRRRTGGEGSVQGHHCAWLPHVVAHACGDRTGAGDPRAHRGPELRIEQGEVSDASAGRFPGPCRCHRGERTTENSGRRSVFKLTYEIDGEARPACVADVIVLYP